MAGEPSESGYPWRRSSSIARARHRPLTGRHLVAAFRFGAVGVWSGTVWLASDEWEGGDAPEVLQSPYQMLLTSRSLQGANDARRPDGMTEAVGQGVAFVTRAQPVRSIVDEMVDEARRVLARSRS